MATLTINYYEQAEVSSGSISLVSTTSDACQTVIVVDVDPGVGNKLVEFSVKNGTANITPPASVISSLTQYTITIEGYQSGLSSENTTGTKAGIFLKSEDGLTTIDVESYIRSNKGVLCDEITVDPGDPPIVGGPVDPNDCSECITDGSELPTINDPLDFDNNGGFGYDDWGIS